MLLRKDCKPGIPGCVLYKKVRFIAEVEAERAKRKAPRKTRKPSGRAR